MSTRYDCGYTDGRGDELSAVLRYMGEVLRIPNLIAVESQSDALLIQSTVQVLIEELLRKKHRRR